MDFVVPIFLKVLFDAAKKAGLLDLAQKTGEALYEQLVQERLGPLFKTKLGRLIESAVAAVAKQHAVRQSQFMLAMLTDPTITAALDNLGSGELPTRSLLVPVFQRLLPGADAAVAVDSFVEKLYNGLSRDQEMVNHAILLLSEKEAKRHETVLLMLQAILQQLQQPQTAPAPPLQVIPTTRLTLAIDRAEDHRFTVTLHRGEEILVPPQPAVLPRDFPFTYEDHLKALASGLTRGWTTPVASRDQLLDRLGRQLAAFFLPGEIGNEVHEAILGAQQRNERVEITFRSSDPQLLSLPIEATHDPAVNLPLVLYPHVAVCRALADAVARPLINIPGPLRLLVLIASPDEEKTNEPLLDLEAELRTILDAVDHARHGSNCIVEILEEGSLENLQAKLEAEPFHVLHISCHGKPGALILEDRDGNPVEVSPQNLADTIAATGHPHVPLIVLASCLTGVAAAANGESDLGSFAAQLVQRGFPAVVAMQHPVSDEYATSLAGYLYKHLADDEVPSPLWALSKARRQVELERQQRARGKETGSQGGKETTSQGGKETSGQGGKEARRQGGKETRRQGDKETGRQGGKETTSQGGKETRSQGGKETTSQGGKETRSQGGKETGSQGGKETSGQGGKETRRQGDKETRRQGDKETGREEPEYATPALYLGGEEVPLFDRRQPFDRVRPQPHLAAVPGLCLRRVGDFIGRRRQQRQIRRALADQGNIGAIITGMGGVGKSALAGHVIENLVKENWLPVTLVGRVNENDICRAVGDQLWSRAEHLQLPNDHVLRRFVAPLRTVYGITDEQRRLALSTVLQNLPVLLLLDNFEDNLDKDRRTFLDPELEGFLQDLTALPLTARLLLTCRHPVPALRHGLSEIPLGPLSVQEMRKLLLRLPNLKDLAPTQRLAVYQKVGGHPRLLEFLDAILGGGKARFADVSRKLENKLHELNLAPEALPENLDEALQTAVAVGCRDILLDELMALAQQNAGDWELLLGAAVYEQPVDLTGLAFQRFGRPALPDEAKPLALSAWRLASLSLLSVGEVEHYFVHRWTAGPLLQKAEPAQQRHWHQAAADYWQWRVRNQSYNIHEGILAVRHLLQAENFDAAFEEGWDILVQLMNWGHYSEAAGLNREMITCFPTNHDGYPKLLGNLGDLLRSLGEGEAARQFYEKSLEIRAKLTQAEPNRADYARDLSVSYERMGDLLRSLGEGEAARQYYEKSLEIRAKLAQAEPNRADYARDLSVSYSNMGDLLISLGEGEAARQYYEKDLEITAKLARAEPNRADYARDLSVSYNKMGDLLRSLGEGEAARQFYEKALEIAAKLAQAEPNRADYASDLSVSYNKMGDLLRSLGEGEAARQYYEKALAIAAKLAQAEPNRADYARDLSVSYSNMGDLLRSIGEGEAARQYYERCHEILSKLAQAEPNRADYARDLSVSYERMGDLLRSLSEGEAARQFYEKALEIAAKLAQAEPNRADYARDLSVSYNKMGDLLRSLGEGEAARQYYEKALEIAAKLAQAEPNRADYARDLSVSYNKMGDLLRSLGEGEAARQFYEKSLEIRSKLAQAEPSLLERQLDLVVSFYKLSLISPPKVKRDHLNRALQILLELQRVGKLPPANAGWIPAIQQELAKAGEQ